VAVSGEPGSGNRIFAANFSQGRIDVFDSNWNPVVGPGFVATAPAGKSAADFAPGNVQRVIDASLGRNVLIVAYAKIANAAAGEEESTDGFLAKFELDGSFLGSSAGGGNLNAPWGVTLAPSGFGELSNLLIVGNFGDGEIHGYDVGTLDYVRTMLDLLGNPVAIDGLWDLKIGNGASLGRADRLYFAAGPEEETRGLFGAIASVPEPASVLVQALALGGLGVVRGRLGKGRLGFAQTHQGPAALGSPSL